MLANFYLKPFIISNKEKKIKNFANIQPEHVVFLEKWETHKNERPFVVDVSFSLFGIRNLIYKAKKPIVRVRLTFPSMKYKDIRVPEQFW